MWQVLCWEQVRVLLSLRGFLTNFQYYFLGTALMGEKAAMACTVAVETVIVEHYNEQLRQIMDSPNPDKVKKVENFCLYKKVFKNFGFSKKFPKISVFIKKI